MKFNVPAFCDLAAELLNLRVEPRHEMNKPLENVLAVIVLMSVVTLMPAATNIDCQWVGSTIRLGCLRTSTAFPSNSSASKGQS